MTPLMPQAGGDFSDLALDIYRKSASLGGQLHPITRGGLELSLQALAGHAAKYKALAGLSIEDLNRKPPTISIP